MCVLSAAYLHTHPGHSPATEKYQKLYMDNWNGPVFDWPAYDLVSESPEAVQHVRKLYASLLTMTDAWLGKLFDQLDAANLWDDTLIILSTDHGTMLGVPCRFLFHMSEDTIIQEKNYWEKSYMPVYNEIAKLPLIIHYPGQTKQDSRRVNALTQSIDIMPTILQHHKAALPPHVLGKSLLPLLDRSQDKVRDDIIFGYFGMATNITDGEFVYFRNPVNKDGGPLYEYTSTPTWFEHQPQRGHWQKKRRFFSKVEMGRYFGHTYNLPLYR